MADLEDVVSVRKCLMLEHPQMNIHSNLTDAHCYIIERWVLDFLKNEKYFLIFNVAIEVFLMIFVLDTFRVLKAN